MEDLRERYTKEKFASAEYNETRYRDQYVWWLEYKVLELEKDILIKRKEFNCTCADNQGGPCSACMELKYNL